MKRFKTREELLLSLGNNMKIAEIGVFKGEFSKFILYNLIPEELFLVDTFQGYVGSGDKDGNNIEYTNLEEEYNQLTTYFKEISNVHIVKDYSYNFINQLPDNYLDIIYIDGDHSYEGVIKDLNASYDKIKVGGYICGHDYISPRFEGVVRAVDEFCIKYKLKIDYISDDGCPTYCITKRNI